MPYDFVSTTVAFAGNPPAKPFMRKNWQGNRNIEMKKIDGGFFTRPEVINYQGNSGRAVSPFTLQNILSPFIADISIMADVFLSKLPVQKEQSSEKRDENQKQVVVLTAFSFSPWGFFPERHVTYPAIKIQNNKNQ